MSLPFNLGDASLVLQRSASKAKSKYQSNTPYLLQDLKGQSKQLITARNSCDNPNKLPFGLSFSKESAQNVLGFSRVLNYAEHYIDLEFGFF